MFGMSWARQKGFSTICFSNTFQYNSILITLMEKFCSEDQCRRGAGPCELHQDAAIFGSP